jgi:hypothetical protein
VTRFDALEARIQAAVYRRLANAEVVSDNGTFAAFLAQPDAQYEAVTMGAQVLRYPSAFVLTDGEVIQIDGVEWVVAQPPRRLSAGLESEVEVVRR